MVVDSIGLGTPNSNLNQLYPTVPPILTHVGLLRIMIGFD